MSKGSPISVIVVLYLSEDVIADCLGSLLSQRRDIGRIVLVDNACPGGSVATVRQEMQRHDLPIREVHDDAPPDARFAGVELIRSDRNLGFAGGVNLGLTQLMADPDVHYFWILNPDCELVPGCAEAMLRAAETAEQNSGFSLLGSRILYPGTQKIVQSDGGIYCRLTGRCRNIHQGATLADADGDPSTGLDFISGASMLASRAFIQRAGLMPEDYFLYYEEVAWAYARGNLPLVVCRDAIVLHHVGTAIGSGRRDRLPSPLSNYFHFRSRMRFMSRYHPFALPISVGFSLLKIIQTALRGGWASAAAALRGMFGLPPPRSVCAALGGDRAMPLPWWRKEYHGPATAPRLLSDS